MIILTFAVSLFLLLSNLSLFGPVGMVLKSVQLGIFGTIGFIFPFLLLLAVIFFLSNQENTPAVRKMIAAIFFLIFLSALFQLIGGISATMGLSDFYRFAEENVLSGGVVGGALAMVLYLLSGELGAVVILMVLMLIALVYITEKPLMRMFARSTSEYASKATEIAKDDLQKLSASARSYREERRSRREEARKETSKERREEKVNFDALDLSKTLTEENLRARKNAAKRGELGREIQILDHRVSEFFSGQTGPSRLPLTGGDGLLPEQEGAGAAVQDIPELKRPDSSAVFTGNIQGLLPPERETGSEEAEKDYASSSSPAAKEEERAREAEGAAATVLEMEDLSEEEEEGALFHDAPSDAVLSGTEEDRITIPAGDAARGTRRIVTASGQVIDAEVEQIQKRVEKKRAESLTDSEKEAMQQEILRKKPPRPYRFPPLRLLKRGGVQSGDSKEEIKRNAVTLQQTLKSFGVNVTVTNVSIGPSVTRYELEPEAGVKVAKIVALNNDIKMRLAAADIRIEAPIPGKSAVGIEVPNKKGQTVYLGDILQSEEFRKGRRKLAFGVGKDISGKTVVTDIARMPHLLIAGATGSGKSVSINTLIMSMIYRYSPEEVKMIMVDPKVVELQVYNGIPHLLIPVVTEPKKAAAALNWAVAEMTDRYKKFAETGCRDLAGYNRKVEAVGKEAEIPEEKKPKKLPQILIIIDELADLMMVSAQEVEDAICRIAQLARACGMHLVIATQRPSVNVITGLIKANVPSRIAFAVSSGVDSRTIIDMNGAEKLLGKGDMLFFPQGIPKPIRVQGAFVSDEEVQAVVDFLKENSDTAYDDSIHQTVESDSAGTGGSADERDELFSEAGHLIIEADKASIGMLQRKFRIGFNRAARIMDQLADYQVVGQEEGTKPRRILMSMEEFETLL